MEKLHLGPRKVLRAPALRRGREIIPITDRVKLDRVLGFTVSNNAAFDCDPNSSIVAYPAGCVVVVYNVRKNKQSHILNNSKKTISSLAFSSDGKYLATGECGHLPHVRVWDVQEKFQVAEFQGHKYGINCVAFSPNLKYVVSVGSQHDMIVNVWDWRNNVKVASNKVSCKVKAVSFAASGNYFVTVGNRHVKFWYLEYSRSSKYKMEPVPLMGRSAILGDQRNNYFCDVACGKGDMSESTYAITKSGLLCEFTSRRLLDKWVELRATSANSISVTKEHIFIGCSVGIIRCFNPRDLNFICTLPKPHFLGLDVSKNALGIKQLAVPSSSLKYPDTVAIAVDDIAKKVTCIYNDHSLYVWDIKDLKKIGKSHSYLYHSACIWGIEMYPNHPDEAQNTLPQGTFLTCSSDDTIRIWNIEPSTTQELAHQKNIYSPELLKVVYVDPELTYLCDTDFNPSGSNDKVDTTYDGKNGVRCLRISPNGRHLASGDRSGNIRIHDLAFFEELYKVEAHDSEVLCLEYSKPILVEGKEKEYLASASRDRLVHVFDVKEDYAFQQTLDDHSSSITAVRFVHNGNALQMISCGADKSIIFRKAQFNPDLTFVREHHVVGKTTLYDMEVDNQQNHILTACQDRNIRVYSVLNGKHGRCFRGSQGEDGTLIKVVLDPSGTYLATSCTDKSLYVFDYFTGECLASMFGHSELVTGLKFTDNGCHLISVSGDGCIFLWKLPPDLTQTILSKQASLGNNLPNLWHANRKDTVGISKPIQLSQSADVFNSNLVNSANVNEVPLSAYRFSVGQLPHWAKKQMADELNPNSSSPHKTTDPRLLPRCRWAQRIDGQGLVVPSYLDSDSVLQYPGDSPENADDTLVATDDNDVLEVPEDEVVFRMKTGDQQPFDVPEQSHLEMRSSDISQAGEPSLPKPNVGSAFSFNRDFRELSNVTGGMRLEDMDAEDERSDSEVSEMVYYPASEDGSDVADRSVRPKVRKGVAQCALTESKGAFHVCANVDNELKEMPGNSKRYQHRERAYSDLTANNTPEHLEVNSDEEDVSTPADSERSFLSSLCISTEDLEKLDQRERFMKSNYESLERSDTSRVKDSEIEDKNLYRQSISTKFLTGSLYSPVRVAGERGAALLPHDQQSITPSRKREELNKALSETKKKLETVGFRRGLMSSKSIGDLHIQGADFHRRSHSESRASDIRRAASMSDLPNSSLPCRRLFSSAAENTKELPNENDAATVWVPSSVQGCSLFNKRDVALASASTSGSRSTACPDDRSNKTEGALFKHITVMPTSAKSRNSSSSMHKNSIDNACPDRIQSSYCSLDGKSITSLNSVTKRTNLPSLTAQQETVGAARVSPARGSSSDSSPTEPSPNPILNPLSGFTRSDVRNEPSLSKFATSETHNPLQTVKPYKMVSCSEWDLRNCGVPKHFDLIQHHALGLCNKECRLQKSQQIDSSVVQCSSLSHNSMKMAGGSSPIQCNNVRHEEQPSKLLMSLPGNPTSVPLTVELCESISKSLKEVTTCAMQVYQRLTLNSELPIEERNVMTDILAKGVWQAQQTLRPAIPPVTSWHASSGFDTHPRKLPGLGVQPNELPSQQTSSIEAHIDGVDTLALLHRFSDKLLNLVQQKINSGSLQQSNT